MITKDGRDTRIENLTPDNYIVPKGEERSYHAVIEVVQFDPKTGKKLSKPRVQKFGKKMFETHVLDSLRKQGYTVTILHDPNTWIKEQQEKAKEAKAKAKAAEKAAMKAEIIAELKAEGVIPGKPADAEDDKPKAGRASKTKKES